MQVCKKKCDFMAEKVIFSIKKARNLRAEP